MTIRVRVLLLFLAAIVLPVSNSFGSEALKFGSSAWGKSTWGASPEVAINSMTFGKSSWGNAVWGEITVDNPINSDLDSDGVINELDAFPFDNSESIDSDGDGIGNFADLDDDNDGFTDLEEVGYGSDPLDKSSEPIIGGMNLILIKAILDKQKNN